MTSYPSWLRIALCLGLAPLGTGLAALGAPGESGAIELKTPSVPGSAGPLFSENFESGRLSKDMWEENVTGGNLIEVQSEKVAHGNYALRVSCPVPSNKTWAFVLAKNLPEALREHCFGRAYMLIEPVAPTRHTIFIMEGTPGFPHNRFEEVATANGRWQLTYVDLRPNGDKEDYHSGGNPPFNRWFCLEWEFNEHPNHATIWVDGQLVFQANFVSKTTGSTRDLVGGFTDLALGFRLWGAAPTAFDVYYDDIALDTHRIGPVSEK